MAPWLYLDELLLIVHLNFYSIQWLLPSFYKIWLPFRLLFSSSWPIFSSPCRLFDLELARLSRLYYFSVYYHLLAPMGWDGVSSQKLFRGLTTQSESKRFLNTPLLLSVGWNPMTSFTNHSGGRPKYRNPIKSDFAYPNHNMILLIQRHQSMYTICSRIMIIGVMSWLQFVAAVCNTYVAITDFVYKFSK